MPIKRKRGKKSLPEIVLPESIEIINGTAHKDAGKLAAILAYDIFEFDELTLRMYHLPRILNKVDLTFFGMVEVVYDKPHSYLILLNENLGKHGLMKALCHEFVHIEQFETGRLKIDGSKYRWKNEFGDMEKVPYELRPFELEAAKWQKIILRDLKKEVKKLVK